MNLRPPFYAFGKVIRSTAIDGDTVDVEIEVDIGFGIRTRFKERIRLAGINSPEVVGATKEAGLAATAWIRERLTYPALDTRLVTAQKDKYGRRLGVFFPRGAEEPMPPDLAVWGEMIPAWETSINAEMVRAGHAVEYWP